MARVVIILLIVARASRILSHRKIFGILAKEIRLYLDLHLQPAQFGLVLIISRWLPEGELERYVSIDPFISAFE